MMAADSHKGRTVLITGASAGLGEALADAYAAAGARLVLAARRTDLLDAVAERLRAGGADAIAVPMDVTDEASVRAAYDAAAERFGMIDTVVANAGINAQGTAIGLAEETFEAIVDVNLTGAFRTLREGGRRLLDAGPDVAARGRMLVIGSLGSLHALQGLVAYSASKAGAAMLARGLAREWARHGISVNAICPGYMLTDITRDWFETDAGKRAIERFPRRRLMPVAAVIPLALYLTSDVGGFVTGDVIKIDDAQMVG